MKESVDTVLFEEASKPFATPSSQETSMLQTAELQKMRGQLIELVTNTSAKYEKSLKNFLIEDTRKPHLSDKMLNFLEMKGLLSPYFRIMDAQDADKFLNQNGYLYEKMEPDQLLLVFNLPKPLARYWWKGTNSTKRSTGEIDGAVIEWGKLYEETIHVAREMVEDSGKSGYKLYFHRVNPHAVHDAEQYYYIWKVQAVPFWQLQADYEEDDLIGWATLQRLAEQNAKKIQLGEYIPYDYSDEYFRGSKNTKPHGDFSLRPDKVFRFYNDSYLGERVLTSPDENVSVHVAEVAYKSSRFDKKELIALYRSYFQNGANWEELFEDCSIKLYERLIPMCTYDNNGKREFMSGGTPVMKDTVKTWVEYVLAFESGLLDMVRFDNVINSVHNNGVFAPDFILCDGETRLEKESDAMVFLRELGDLKKGHKT